MRFFVLCFLLVGLVNMAIARPASLSPTRIIPAEPQWSNANCPALTLDSRKLIAKDTVMVEDISFKNCHGKTTSAYWVGPLKREKGKHPAIMFVHWYEPGTSTSNRDEFLAEAKKLASEGVVSMLVSTFWSMPGGTYKKRRWQEDRVNSIQQVEDFLQAIKLLKSLPEVDKTKIAYVGHDYGAVFGSMLTGIDTGIKGFSLVAGTPRISRWYLYGSSSGLPDGPDITLYKESFSAFEPITMIAKTKSKIMLQYAQQDAYVSNKEAAEMLSAAPKDTVFKTYDTVHDMSLPIIVQDRHDWLVNLLNIKTQAK
jgi:dienelactone hydrolase